jgi:hypothetical protein
VDRRLELSKDAPLDICVLFSEYTRDWDEDGGSDEDSDEPQGALPVLEKLFQHAHRWQRAVFQLPESSELDHTEFPNTFPLLQELEIRCLPREDAGTDPSPAFYAPLLRSLRWKSLSLMEILVLVT